MASPRDAVAIVGAGRMGCALAAWVSETRRERAVLVWNRSPDVRARLDQYRVTRAVTVADDLASLPARARTLFLAVPAGAIEPVVRAMADALEPDHRIILVAKGVDESFRRGSKVVHDLTCVRRIAALGGPLLATEIAAGHPQAIVVASGFDAMLGEIHALLDRPRTWLIGTHDLPGVEIAGAMRNVSSIAAGIAEAQGLSEASRATILTRGLLDAVELGRRLGGQVETFYGLCGVGDLVARREASYSRNFRLGLRIGEGASLAQALAEVTGEPEGMTSARAARAYADRKGMRAVVPRAVAAVLEGADPHAELEAVLSAGFPTAPVLAGAQG